MEHKYRRGQLVFCLFDGHVRTFWGFRTNRGHAVGWNEGYHLRDEFSPYKALLWAGKDHIGLDNTFFWGVMIE